MIINAKLNKINIICGSNKTLFLEGPVVILKMNEAIIIHPINIKSLIILLLIII